MKLRSDLQRTPSEDLLGHLALRLTDRDRTICQLLSDHRVLTTDQIRDLVFGDKGHVRRRLVTLHRLAVIDRFRPHRETGSAPYHYVLGPMGAAVLAAQQGIDLADLGYRRDQALAIAHNQRLDHLVGVNGFFAALAAAARRRPDTKLVHWWSERRCAASWGEIVRPDSYGHWHENGADVDFFLEYDRGTEPLHRLVDKLDGYTDLQTATGVTTTRTLFWLQGPRREAGLRKLLAATPVPVATAHGASGHGPADPVWLQTGAVHPARQRLSQLRGSCAPLTTAALAG